MPLPSIPLRPADGHKGTFGTVGVLGGQGGRGGDGASRVMIGAPALAATAALRAGCGLAVLIMPRPVLRSALVMAPCATGVALPVDRQRHLDASASAEVLDQHLHSLACLAVGPGLGTGEAQTQVVIRLISGDEVPLVLDADALNVLADAPRFDGDLRAPAVITPHPGEFRRLADALRLDVDPLDPHRRPAAAETLAQRLGCVVVLKGAGTVISNGIETHVNETGSVALATGGSGDVLTGVIASFVAQWYDRSSAELAARVGRKVDASLSLLDCARLAVHVHGLAADRWSQRNGNAGLLATDLLNELPPARQSLEAP